MKKLIFLILNTIFVQARAQENTPAQLYPELFKNVQMSRIYDDGKTFPDAFPLKSADVINAAYQSAVNEPKFDLAAFVNQNFKLPATVGTNYKTNTHKSLRSHIDTLWTVLTRTADTSKGGSLLPLPHPYIVPGGRFREVYYWDSYFTMLGLEQSKNHTLMSDMVANFAYLINKYGHVPNGNRSYYLSRSQPPFFSLMVRLLSIHYGQGTLVQYRPQLLGEYRFWMKGADRLLPGSAYQHSVKMPDGEVLNRYWDASDQPREESYREDVMAAAAAQGNPSIFYRNIRAAAESGWDFSSRWFADGMHLNTIQTLDLIPVDLNCLLYHLEETIAKSYQISGEGALAANYQAKARNRKNAILKYCWDEQNGYFTDYNWQKRKCSDQATIATAFPLFFKIATPIQAAKVTQTISAKFLKPGGVATSLVTTGQQWDMPNGWAPLQYITVIGLENYGQESLAKEVAIRWIKANIAAFNETGKLQEKYNVELEGAAAKAGGGEYPLQDGFGWTNGVLLTLMNKYNIP